MITVPAYFGLAEKEATRRAGQIAGLNVLDMLAEPVAAALHYQALNDTGADRYLLVYDLGGGTFDTTVIQLSGQDVQVVCTDGDHKLGGADWDNRDHGIPAGRVRGAAARHRSRLLTSRTCRTWPRRWNG